MEKVYQRKRDFILLGSVGICATTKEEFVREAFTMPTSPVSATIDLVGVPAVVMAREDESIAEMYNSATMATIDGMPIVKIARRLGYNCDRCSAPDIMGMIFEESIKQNKSHYFYGGKNDEVLEKLKSNLETSYSGIRICGMYSPPFRPLTEDEDKVICKEINELRPDFLWVGIGCPKQELWMQAHAESIHNTVMLGVGAGFDFFAGTLDKAPEWVEKASLEWLFRLTKEPKRLWRRYIIGGFKWIYYRMQSKLKEKSYACLNRCNDDK